MLKYKNWIIGRIVYRRFLYHKVIDKSQNEYFLKPLEEYKFTSYSGIILSNFATKGLQQITLIRKYNG
jgi:hypothetical protein